MKVVQGLLIVAMSALSILMFPVHAVGAEASGEKARRPSTEDLRLLYAVMMTIQETAAKPVSFDALTRAAVSGMLKAADEDNEYYPQTEFDDYTTARSEGAVGLELASRGDALLIISPVVGGPAELAGLLPQDRIVSINGESVAAASVAKALQLLRGPVGSKVQISVSRADAVVSVDLERRQLKVSEVSVRRGQQDILLLKVTAFRSNTLEAVSDQLQKAWSERPFRGLVLDLQNNPGGLFQHAVGLAALFLPPDAVVAKTMGQSDDAKAVYFARPQFYLRSQEADPWIRLPVAIKAVPLMVVVNAGTASGAEVVAGALQQHGRARVAGHQTFGRAKVQTIRPLPGHGAVRVTSGLIHGPDGRSYEGGVLPDLMLSAKNPAAAADEASSLLSKALGH